MIVYLLVVSADTDLIEFVGKKKGAVFPKDSMKRGYLSESNVETIVTTANAADFETPSDLETHLAGNAMGADFLVVMIDSDRSHLAQEIRSAALVCEVDLGRAASGYQNYLHERLGKLLKTIGHLARLFDDGSDSVLLSLPLRNFKCTSLRELWIQLGDDPCIPGLVTSIDTEMKQLRQRVRPRKKTSYKTRYVVDDMKRFFVYGKEHHSLPETGPPHRTSCMITARFRFGRRIDHTRHYNVSEGEGDKTHIQGVFVDCHGDNGTVTARTHINMFSNDYFDN